jgi:DNA-binding transcriptional regulator YiaG
VARTELMSDAMKLRRRASKKGNAMTPKASSPIDRFISDKVLKRRREVGMTQQALATNLGVTFQQVQKYEKGTNRISAGRLLTIARALETPIGYFFEGAPKGV